MSTTDLSTLDSAAIKASATLLQQLLSEQYPDRDLVPGSVLNQVLIQPNSVLDVMNRTDISTLQVSSSLQAASDNPDIADPDIVDALMSNYMISRTPAANAQGQLIIVLSNSVSFVLSAATTFTANGRTFNPTSDYSIYTNSSLATRTTDKVLTLRGDGNYWFSITVVENVAGGPTVSQGVAFVALPEPPGYVESYAADNFQSGVVAESNADLLAKLDEGIAASAMADRVSIAALVKTQFPSITDTSIIGYGDSEMTRDSYNIFGMSHGGKYDIYARTAATPLTFKYTVVVMQQSPVTSEFLIQPTLLPGFYRVQKITRVNDNGAVGYAYSEMGARGVYIPTGEATPVINRSSEAAFTKYQGVARVRIDDADTAKTWTTYINSLSDTFSALVYTSPSGESEILTGTEIKASAALGYRFYDVYLQYLPYIEDVQDYLVDRNRQQPGADIPLMKAPVPCFVAVDIIVGYSGNSGAPDTNAIKNAIVSAINTLPYSAPTLQASLVAEAVAAVLGTTGYVILPLTLRGALTLPDSTIVMLSSQTSLDIPNYYDLGVSRRTVSYLTTADDITLTLQAVTSVNV